MGEGLYPGTMRRLVLAILLAAVATPVPARAGCHIIGGDLRCDPDLGVRAAPPVRPIVSAAYLAEACSSADRLRQAGCAGFISGVADSYAWRGWYCVGPDRFEVERSVIDYVRRVPMQGLSATQMVLEALRAQWPCR
jgi:Rap1a immunity proteins